MMNEEEIVSVLQYLKKFRNKLFVIKFSGDATSNKKVLDSLVQDLSVLHGVGIKLVVVHGASKEISHVMKELGIKPEFMNGLRVTDEKTMDIVVSVLQATNNKIVGSINRDGVNAVGVSGVSGKIFMVKKKSEKLGLVGDITEVDTELVSIFLDNDYIPIIFPIGTDENGRLLNINADTAASELASALKAEKLIILTNVKGIMENPSDDTTLISKLRLDGAEKLINGEFIEDGMKPKLKGCITAAKGGVARTHIIEIANHSLLKELLTTEGTGTMITK